MSTDEDNSSASDWELTSESSQWSNSTGSHSAPPTPPCSESLSGMKRKIDHGEESEKDSRPRSELTWPSLVFSRSLNPLEVRLNMRGDRGQVVVARSVADVATSGEETKEESEGAKIDQNSAVSQATNPGNSSQATSLATDWLTQEQGASQISDWPFLDSQTSSLGLDDFPDSQLLF